MSLTVPVSESNLSIYLVIYKAMNHTIEGAHASSKLDRQKEHRVVVYTALRARSSTGRPTELTAQSQRKLRHKMCVDAGKIHAYSSVQEYILCSTCSDIQHTLALRRQDVFVVDQTREDGFKSVDQR